MQFAWVTAVGLDILIPSEKPIIAEGLCARSLGEMGRQREGARDTHSKWQRGACKAVSEPRWRNCGWHDNRPLTAAGDRPQKHAGFLHFLMKMTVTSSSVISSRGLFYRRRVWREVVRLWSHSVSSWILHIHFTNSLYDGIRMTLHEDPFFPHLYWVMTSKCTANIKTKLRLLSHLSHSNILSRVRPAIRSVSACHLDHMVSEMTGLTSDKSLLFLQ